MLANAGLSATGGQITLSYGDSTGSQSVTVNNATVSANGVSGSITFVNSVATGSLNVDGNVGTTLSAMNGSLNFNQPNQQVDVDVTNDAAF